MKNSHRLLVGLIGLAAVASTGLAQNGRAANWGNNGWGNGWGNNQNTCAPIVNNRGRNNSNFGVAVSFGNTRGVHGSRFNNQYWGANRGFSRAGHDFWIGNNRAFGHNTWHRPVVYQQPVVVYDGPAVRHRPLIVERPIVVERPVVIEQTVIERPVVDRRVVIERPVYEQPTTTQTIIRNVPAYRDIVVQDPATRYRPGWNALKVGDAGYAREFFTDQAVLRPDDATPKAGLAIARAILGQDDQAEWAMRRTVRAGIDRARDGLPGLDLETSLNGLEERYTERSRTYNDRWFMLAATRYLLGDAAGAKEAARTALSVDERDADARRLFDLASSAG